MRHPCLDCEYGTQDKNNDKCKNCDPRIEYDKFISSSDACLDRLISNEHNSKICETCKKIKLLSEFDKATNSPDKKTKNCSECRSKMKPNPIKSNPIKPDLSNSTKTRLIPSIKIEDRGNVQYLTKMLNIFYPTGIYPSDYQTIVNAIIELQ